MSARRLREWPRLIAVAVVLAVALVLIGVVVASASSGGGARRRSPATTAAALRRVQRQSAQLRADQQALASTHQAVRTGFARLVSLKARLVASRARARCWRGRALHPASKSTVDCATLR